MSVVIGMTPQVVNLEVRLLILVVDIDVSTYYKEYVYRLRCIDCSGNQGWDCTFLTPDQPRYAADMI